MQKIEEIERDLALMFEKIDDIAFKNQKRILKAFEENKVGLEHFNGSSGYGYSDLGKEKLAGVYSSALGAEDAIVSPYFTCGTHTLSTALFGILRTGDCVISVTGGVYDSLQNAIDGDGIGSLKEYGINFYYVDLQADGDFNYDKIKAEMLAKKPKLIYLQRSSGYANRDCLSNKDIEKICKFVKSVDPKVKVFVDFCYGTFTEEKSPLEVGADIIVDSLNKNPGGGIVSNGGYVAGNKELIEKIAHRLYGVGLGAEVGAYSAGYRELFQGFFMAPSVVAGALKGQLLVGKVLEKMGIASYPTTDKLPLDLIRRIEFKDRKKMIKFIQCVQKYSPVDAYAVPEPSDMPGYDDPVIMAAGCFVQGSSMEMSADGPLRAPFTAYFQGGISYYQIKAFAEAYANTLEK